MSFHKPTNWFLCRPCGGTGQTVVKVTDRRHRGSYPGLATCVACSGSGYRVRWEETDDQAAAQAAGQAFRRFTADVSVRRERQQARIAAARPRNTKGPAHRIRWPFTHQPSN